VLSRFIANKGERLVQKLDHVHAKDNQSGLRFTPTSASSSQVNNLLRNWDWSTTCIACGRSSHHADGFALLARLVLLETMRMRSKTVGLVCIVVLISAPLLSQQTGAILEQVVPPILTEETLPEEPGECNLRTSVDYRASNLEPANALPRLQFFCGLASRWGGEVDVPFAYPDQRLRNVGFGDVSTTLKYSLTGTEKRSPAIVIGVETRFPTGTPSRGTGEEGFEVEPLAALLIQGSHLGLQGNAGIGFHAGAGAQTARTYYYNAAATLRFTSRRVYFIGEANATHSPGGDSILSLSPGLHYGITEQVYVALAVPVPVQGGLGRAGIVTQLQFPLRGRRGRE
jgi:hypothetical protein